MTAIKWHVPILLPADPANPLEASTKQYVDAGLALKAPLVNAPLTGVPTAPTAASGTNTPQLATTAFVQQEISTAFSSETGASILTKLLTVDGSGSGLDADLLDGLSSASFVRADTTTPTFGVGAVNTDVILNVSNPGIGFASGFNFIKTNDGAGISVTEYNSDQTLYEMWMSDNPDTAVDIFSWRFTDYQGLNGVYQPLQISALEHRFVGVNSRFYSPILQTTTATFSTGDPTKTNNTKAINYFGDVTKLKVTGTGTVSITAFNVTGYTGANGKVIWLKLTSATTFDWGYGSFTSSPVTVESGVAVSTSPVTLSNGIAVTFSSTSTGVAGDVFQCRLYRKPTATLSDTTVTGTLAVSGAATLSAGLTLTGNASVSGTLGVTGNCTFGGVVILNQYSGGLRFGTFNAGKFYAHGPAGPGDNVFDLTQVAANDYNVNFTGAISSAGNVVWHAGNDGAASGLDADLLDGQHGSYYTDLAHATGSANSLTVIGNSNLGTTVGTVVTVGATGAFTTFSASTASLAADQVLAIIDGSVYRSGEFRIQAYDAADGKYHTATFLVVHNGVTAAYTEYGDIDIGGRCADFNADFTGGNLRLLATPLTASTVAYKIMANLTKL